MKNMEMNNNTIEDCRTYLRGFAGVKSSDGCVLGFAVVYFAVRPQCIVAKCCLNFSSPVFFWKVDVKLQKNKM
jgi:hypothetical protein